MFKTDGHDFPTYVKKNSAIWMNINICPSVLLNGSAMSTMAEWCGRFFANHHRQFVKGGLLWQRHRPQWHVYMAEFWPSAIDSIGRSKFSNFPTDQSLIYCPTTPPDHFEAPYPIMGIFDSLFYPVWWTFKKSCDANLSIFGLITSIKKFSNLFPGVLWRLGVRKLSLSQFLGLLM